MAEGRDAPLIWLPTHPELWSHCSLTQRWPDNTHNNAAPSCRRKQPKSAKRRRIADTCQGQFWEYPRTVERMPVEVLDRARSKIPFFVRKGSVFKLKAPNRGKSTCLCSCCCLATIESQFEERRPFFSENWNIFIFKAHAQLEMHNRVSFVVDKRT